MSENIYLTQVDLSETFKISTKTLEATRCKGTGPKFYKFGHRVLYKLDDVETYLEANAFCSTSEYGA